MNRRLAVLLCLFVSNVYALDLDNYQALTSDTKAFRIGEPVTIIVVESTSAESRAGTGLARDVGVAGEASDSKNSVSAGLGISADSNGTGQTSRIGKVRTQLSALITEVLPNQMYRIRGHQNLVVNNEHQEVIISGLIRGIDISSDNSLPSYKVAEASIHIVGTGDVSEAQTQGLIYKIMTTLGFL